MDFITDILEVPGYPDYFINMFGSVFSKKSGSFKRLKAFNDTKGYPTVIISDREYKRRTVKIHRLMAEVFFSEQDLSLTVNHKDCNKQNNYLFNLELISNMQNMKHAVRNGCYKNCARGESQGNNKLTAAAVYTIRHLYASGEYTYKQLGEIFDTVKGNIGDICRGSSWKHLL